MRAARLVPLALSVACSAPGGAFSPPTPPAPRPLVATPLAPTPAPDPGAPALPYLKGSTHVHTVYSGDSSTPVADVRRWYRERGYDFIVVTDHNRVTEAGDDAEAEADGGLLVLRGIELTHNPPACDPPPPEPDGRCRIHVNGLALAVPPPPPGADGRPAEVTWKNQTSAARADLYQAAIDKTRELGGVVQINHPTWHRGVDASLLAELARRGAVLVEIANQGFAAWNEGTAVYPSAEAVWDGALAEGARIWGVASDDAHDYDDGAPARQAAGARVYPPGGGWIMVRAERSADGIRRALEHGDFYASTGVTLERAEVVDGALEVRVADRVAGDGDRGAHEITFVGTGGAVLERVIGRAARFELGRAPPGYVRAVVVRDDGKRAWVQPVTVP